MKAARMHEYGKPVVLEDVPVPDIKPDEILVQVKACGMCRSDAQLVDGYFRKYADIPPPITLGHEITGVVHKIGSVVPKVAGLEEGDHVVVAPGWGDGVCRHCLVGNTHICPNVSWPGFGPYGGFAEFVPVPARLMPSAARSDAGTNSSLATRERSTKVAEATPSSSNCWATAIATVVFPLPPAPTTDTRRESLSACRMVSMASVLPMMRVVAVGSLLLRVEAARATNIGSIESDDWTGVTNR